MEKSKGDKAAGNPANKDDANKGKQASDRQGERTAEQQRDRGAGSTPKVPDSTRR